MPSLDVEAGVGDVSNACFQISSHQSVSFQVCHNPPEQLHSSESLF